ncbi:acyl carrier protein [Corallincola luteus]|uniref:Acyl carrier protein n=2 Tax=Corallincola TaxID=1775176 RepID=A0A368NU90_9GAMM|nr:MULTISPECIES: phosphopantetheine-binding protein [Corallincola]RCU52781.1 acyl carrier protein [Corallincola holothuriorum]TCI03282.1 acyl carrier protein [Corallincola luteus]
MTELKVEIKQLIIDALNLEDISIQDIEDEAPLFVDGLGLDSIDALELGVAIKKRYNVMLETDSKETRKHFYSVQTLAEFVSSKTE